MTFFNTNFSNPGGVSSEGRLREVRNELIGAFKEIRSIEENLIFLLVHPEIVTVATTSKKSSSNTNNKDSSTEINRALRVNHFSTNASELRARLSELGDFKKGLQSNEYSLIQSIVEAEKHAGSSSNDPTKNLPRVSNWVFSY